METPPATQADIARPLRRRREIRAPPAGQDGRRLRRNRSGGTTAPRQHKHPVVAAAAAARQGRCAPRPRAMRPPTSPYATGKARLAEPAPPPSQRESHGGRTCPRRHHRARRLRRGQAKTRVARWSQDGRRLGRARSGGAAAEDRKSCNGTAAPQRRAGGSTPSLPPPPPPARGDAPPRRGRCGPRHAPTPRGKRASQSPRRRRRSANRMAGGPAPVGVTAPADCDEGGRRRASRAGAKTAADWAALDPATPPQRTENLATAPPRPSAAPVEAPRRCRRRRRLPGAMGPHADGVAAPDVPLRHGESALRGARAAAVAARIACREGLPPSPSPRTPTPAGAGEDARRAPAPRRPPIGPRFIRRRRRTGPKLLQQPRRAPAPRRWKHPVVAAAAAASQGRCAPMPRVLRPASFPYATGKARIAEPAPPSSQRKSVDGKTSTRRRHRAHRRRRGQSQTRVARWRQNGRRLGRA